MPVLQSIVSSWYIGLGLCFVTIVHHHTNVVRKYINVEKGALVPTVASFVVTDLLEEHCPDFVDTGFTAR